MHPLDMSEEDALRQVAPDFDPGDWTRDERSHSHWLDRFGGDPGTHIVLFKPTQT